MGDWKATWSNDRSLSAAMVRNMDDSSDPCEDFYKFACGGPGSRFTHAGNALDFIALQIWQMLQASAPSAETTGSAPAGAEAHNLLRQMHALCTQQAPPDKLGVAPMRPLVDRILAISDVNSLMSTIALLHTHGVGVFFIWEVAPGLRNPDEQVVYLRPAGLGLGIPRPYVDSDSFYGQLRDQYRQWAKSALGEFDLPGYPDDRATNVLEVEIQLARSYSVDSTDDPNTTYQPFDASTLASETGLPWDVYFRETGMPPDAKLNVSDASYFRRLGGVLQRWKQLDVQSYLIWQMYARTSSLIQRAGVRVTWIRSMRCVQNAKLILGQELEREYVKRYADGRKEIGAAIWEDVRGSLLDQLRQSTLLDPDLRGAFIGKISAIEPLIGYPSPSQWPSVRNVELVPGGLYENGMTARRRHFADAVDRIGKPVVRGRWTVSMFSPLAMNQFHWNHVSVPLPLLYPPRLGPNLPVEVSYAGLGMIVGHEMAHAIDPHGRWLDANGRLLPPIPSEAEERLLEGEECLSAHFSRFERSPKFYSRLSASMKEATYVDPEKTRDENFADVVGLRAAYLAYRSRHPADAPPRPIAGLEGDKLFFLAYAQNWCSHSNPFVERYVDIEDKHAPNHARVNGVLALMPEFGAAFGCAAGSPMRVETRCDPL